MRWVAAYERGWRAEDPRSRMLVAPMPALPALAAPMTTRSAGREISAAIPPHPEHFDRVYAAQSFTLLTAGEVLARFRAR